MPALHSIRMERFCQLVKQGIPPYRAYPMAGYKFHNGEPYRLRGNPRVKRRLAELTKGLAMKTRVTVQSISDQLDEDREFAQKVEQAGPALNASIAKAKLHGLLIDRKESGAPGDFAAAATPDAVLAMVRQELGDATADALLAALGQQDAVPIEVEPVVERGDDTLQ